jgi:hypothetical protein
LPQLLRCMTDACKLIAIIKQPLELRLSLI